MLELEDVVYNEVIKNKFKLGNFEDFVYLRKEDGISKITSETREFVEKSCQQSMEQNKDVVR